MRMLFLILILLASSTPIHQPPPQMIIFSSDGTFYKFQTSTYQVQWKGNLGSKLLSFQLGNTKDEWAPSQYLLPTLDGHFIYVDSHSQILIDRKQVQQLLHVCLERNSQEKTSEFSQFFIYQKYEYYIINLANGKSQDIQTFLNKPILQKNQHLAVLKISKKYLKQLRRDMTVAWSTISSQLDLIPIDSFLADPKSIHSRVLENNQSTLIKFRRTQTGQIELTTKEGVFELGGNSPVLTIFSIDFHDKAFPKHSLNFQDVSALALEDKSASRNSQIKDLIEVKNADTRVKFPHSNEFKQNAKFKASSQLQYCINTFRTLKALTDNSQNGVNFNTFIHEKSTTNSSLIFSKFNGISPPQIHVYGPTQQQPYIWIALILAIVLGSVGLYRMRINSILKELTAIQTKHGKKWQEFQKRLGQTQELKKMYEVYWDKIAYQVAGQQWYEHVVLEGRFLNQNCHVFAVRIERADIITIQHKLNTLLNFSHKSLAKLYYYTKNSQFLLIFAEKIESLASKKLPEYLNVKSSVNSKKQLISQMIQSVSYLDGRIEVNCLPFESISILTKSQLNGENSYKFKLSAVPCLLKKSIDDSDNESQSQSRSNDNNMNELRFNMVAVFHMIICSGNPLNKELLDEKLRNQAYSQEQYLQFFDYVLYEVKVKNNLVEKDIESMEFAENERQTFFSNILDHPYLWDSKRKILFITDFSNYIQTHIDDYKLKKLESHAKDYKVIKIPWIKEFHFLFAKEISTYRKYDYQSVRDLIRVIRNKLNHFHEIPKDVKVNIGDTPQGFVEYCLDLFPKLLHFAFVYTKKKKWKLHMK